MKGNSFLFDLGNALYKFFDGQELSYKELNMVANADDSTKLIALYINACERLEIRNDKSLVNLYKNNDVLKSLNNVNKTK